MKHIKEQYGQKCNELVVTSEELQVLEPFLLALGIRCRTTVYEIVDGVPTHTIEAQNPYKIWIGEKERKFADDEFTELRIGGYKR